MFVNRSVVYALSLGSSYKLGIENGMVGSRWKTSKSKVASSTNGSSQMLTILFCAIFVPPNFILFSKLLMFSYFGFEYVLK